MQIELQISGIVELLSISVPFLKISILCTIPVIFIYAYPNAQNRYARFPKCHICYVHVYVIVK